MILEIFHNPGVLSEEKGDIILRVIFSHRIEPGDSPVMPEWDGK